MKAIVSSDWHPDAVTAGLSRFEDVRQAAEATVKDAIKQDAGAYIFSGDLCDPDSGPCVFRCIELAQRVAIGLAIAGIPSFWIAGNHDVIEDGTGDTTLSPLRALTGLTITVLERPAVLSLGESATLVALPYVAKALAYEPEEFLRPLVEGLNADGKTVVVVGHLTVPGIVPGSESREMARGRDILFPLEACHAIKAPKLLLNGHYHRRQVFRTPGNLEIYIPGSLERLAFGEENNEPGWLVLEV